MTAASSTATPAVSSTSVRDFEDKKGKWSTPSAALDLLNTLDATGASSCGNSQLETVEELIRSGQVNAMDPNRRTALHFSVRRGLLPVVERLLQVEAIDVNACDGWGDTALHMLTEELGTARKAGGGTAPEAGICSEAAQNNYKLKVKILEALLAREDLEVELPNEMGMSVLHVAASQHVPAEPLDLILKRISCSGGIGINAQNLRNESPLMVAIGANNALFYENSTQTERLLAHSLNLSLQLDLGKEKSLLDEGDGDNLLLYAIKSGNKEILSDLFLENEHLLPGISDAELLNLENKKGTTPLIHACALGEDEFLLDCVFGLAERLLAQALRARTTSEKSGSSETGAEESPRDGGDAVAKLCAWLQERAKSRRTGVAVAPPSALSLTPEEQTLVKIKLCADEGDESGKFDPDDFLDLNAQDKRGNTCLHIAAAFGHDKVIARVQHFSYEMSTVLGDGSVHLLSPIDVNEKNREGNSVLLAAASSGRIKVVEAILENSAHSEALGQEALDLKLKDAKGRNARQRAKGAGCDDIETVLKNFKPPSRAVGLGAAGGGAAEAKAKAKAKPKAKGRK
eukprot:g10287.t1